MPETLWRPGLSPKARQTIFKALLERYNAAWDVMEANDFGSPWLHRRYKHEYREGGKVHSTGHPNQDWSPGDSHLSSFEHEVTRLEFVVREAQALRAIAKSDYAAQTPPWRIHPAYHEGFAVLLAETLGAVRTEAENMFGQDIGDPRGAYECHVIGEYYGPDGIGTRSALNTGFGKWEHRFPNAEAEQRFLTLLRLLEAYGAAKYREGHEAGSNLLTALRDGSMTAAAFEEERENAIGAKRG